MVDDILCPTCGHSLAFHKYDYGSCEAPLGGLTSKNMCGCPFTLRTLIENMQSKNTTEKLKYFEQLEINYQNRMDELINAHAVLVLAKKKIEFLESKIKIVRELLDKIKPVGKDNPVSEWIRLFHRNNVIKIVNEIILELEKDMDND